MKLTINEILELSTVQLRKGPMVEETTAGNVDVAEFYFMPDESEAPANLVKVDCHFIVVGVDSEKAVTCKADFVEFIKQHPQPERFLQGPSYIEIGAWIGDQGAALQLFALGQVLGFWEVMTPAFFGMTGSEATNAAGNGLILIASKRSLNEALQ